MNKLRENTGVILWILVLSFGIIWTLQDSNVFDAMNQPNQNVASVNGTPISNEEFNNAVDQQRQQFNQQVDGDLTAQMEEVIRQQAYDRLINSALLEQEMDRLGLMVTNAEVEELVFGETPHPVIRQQFADSTGQINYQLLSNMAQNPQARPQWIQLEQYLREQRREQKMSSLIQSTIFVSDEDVENHHFRQHARASAQYAALRYASVPDDSISATEDDLRAFYDENREDFRRKKTLTLEYVSLPKVPTAQDTAAVLTDLEDLQDRFASAENDSLFLEQNASAQSFSREYQTPDALNDAVASAIYEDPSPGRIAGPVTGDGLAHLVKILDTEPADGEYVRARHILLETSESDPALRQRLQELRDSIETGGARFSDLARQYSDDTQSAENGGDLGWFGRGRMADAFETAAFNATPGQIVGPVQSQFGYHLIEVTHRASQAVQIADLAFNLNPSQATLTEREHTLEDVAFYAQESSSFTEEAKRRDLEVNRVQAEADQTSIPDVGESPALSSFMETAETGDYSDVIELGDKFIVARVTDVQPEGYRPFEDVKAEIRPQVELEMKKEIQLRRMERARENNSFEELPTVLGTQLRSQSDIRFSTETIPGIGEDPSFVGTVFGLNEGETSRVVEGENAAYVLRVTSLQEPPPLTQYEREQIRQKLLKQRRQEVSSEWIAALKEDAEIEDMRQQSQLR